MYIQTLFMNTTNPEVHQHQHAGKQKNTFVKQTKKITGSGKSSKLIMCVTECMRVALNVCVLGEMVDSLRLCSCFSGKTGLF